VPRQRLTPSRYLATVAASRSAITSADNVVCAAAGWADLKLTNRPFDTQARRLSGAGQGVVRFKCQDRFWAGDHGPVLICLRPSLPYNVLAFMLAYFLHMSARRTRPRRALAGRFRSRRGCQRIAFDQFSAQSTLSTCSAQLADGRQAAPTKRSRGRVGLRILPQAQMSSPRLRV